MPEKHPIVDRYSQMHNQRDVTHELERIAVQRRHQIESGIPKREAVKVPQRPAEKIDAFLDVLQKIHMDRDPEVTERIKQSLHRQYCLDRSKPMPDSWFRTQAKMGEDQGHGLKDELYEHYKATYDAGGDARSEVESQKQALINDQESSLDKWYDYLSRSDTPYPMWFRYFAFKNVTQLGPYNKESHSFAKRSDDTVGAFPELNAEALVYVAESLGSHYGLNQTISEDDTLDIDDPRMQDLLNDQASFGDMYAHALEYCTPASAEMLSVTDGEWVTYPMGTPGIELSSTLDGHGTGWCVAGESYAREYLERGDFMVFYTKDAEGSYTTPRIGIPMLGTAGDEDYSIREVRGIREGQNMEDILGKVLDDKLAELPGSDEYMRAKEDMAQLTDIWKRHYDSEKLTCDDLRFLYEIDTEIAGFGESRDPRIDKLLKDRDFMDDARIIFETSSDNELASRLIDAGHGHSVIENLEKFQGLVADADYVGKLIDRGYAKEILDNLDKFEGLVVDANLAYRMIDAGYGHRVIENLEKFQGLVADADYVGKLIDRGCAKEIFDNLDKFEGLVLDANLAYRMMDAGRRGRGDSLQEVFYNLDKFEGLVLDANLAYRIIDAGRGLFVLRHVKMFQGLVADANLAHRIIDAGSASVVLHNLKRFQGLDQSVLDRLKTIS